MNPRTIPALALLVVAPAVAAFTQQESTTAAPVRFSSIADSFINLSRPGPGTRVWGDLSDSTRNLNFARLDRIAVGLRAPAHPEDTGAVNLMLRENLAEVVTSAIASRVCRFHLWSTPNQFGGWHVASSTGPDRFGSAMGCSSNGA